MEVLLDLMLHKLVVELPPGKRMKFYLFIKCICFRFSNKEHYCNMESNDTFNCLFEAKQLKKILLEIDDWTKTGIYIANNIILNFYYLQSITGYSYILARFAPL